MPPTYKEMDPDLLEHLLEGYEDELTGEARKQEAFYRQFRCPRCGGECEKHFLGVGHSFSSTSDTYLPRSGLKCKLCECVFDPHSDLIVGLGNAGKISERIQPTLVPLIKPDDD